MSAVLSKKAELSLANKNELMSVEGYTLSGATNAVELRIVINDQLVDSICPVEGNWEYKLNSELFHVGWNYIEIDTDSFLKPSQKRCGGAVNVLPNGPDVFLPDLNLFDARVNGNGANHKDEGYYDELLGESHQWDGAYFQAQPYEESEALRYDERGIPTVLYGEEYKYNPVTIAQHGLGFHRRYLDKGSEDDLAAFINVSDWLVETQQDDGSYPYDFSFALKPTLTLDKGFVSGMAQGQVLSCLIRAYDVSGDERYLITGHRALEFMVASGDEDTTAGCTRSLGDFCSDYPGLQWCKDYRVAEEYVSDPSSYVLNGDLLALVGLYDWWKGAPEEYGSGLAGQSFFDGLKAVEVLLPYYDYYGWSSYDLLQYTHESSPFFTSGYAHDVHIQVLQTLYDISGDEILAEYRDRFIGYNDDPFWRQTKHLYRAE